MTEIHRQIIDHPAAWTAAGLGGREAVTLHLDAGQLDVIDEILARTRHKGPLETTKADFSHPALDPLLARLREIIQHGLGIAVVTGVTPERWSEQDFLRIYWGFGAHVGNAVVQSRRGDKIAYVEVDKNSKIYRGYRTDNELGLHTDAFEHLGLMSVRHAASGGISRMASALAIHNEMLKARPDLLEALYEGFFSALPEMSDTSRPLSARKVPIFGSVDGEVSCIAVFTFLRDAARNMGVPMPAILEEAMDFFRDTAERPDIHLKFMLEPGEMMFWNNYTCLHARTAFKNSPEHERLLYRLWTEVPGGRKLTPDMAAHTAAYLWSYTQKLASDTVPA